MMKKASILFFLLCALGQSLLANPNTFHRLCTAINFTIATGPSFKYLYNSHNNQLKEPQGNPLDPESQLGQLIKVGTSQYPIKRNFETRVDPRIKNPLVKNDILYVPSTMLNEDSFTQNYHLIEGKIAHEFGHLEHHDSEKYRNAHALIPLIGYGVIHGLKETIRIRFAIAPITETLLPLVATASGYLKQKIFKSTLDEYKKYQEKRADQFVIDHAPPKVCDALAEYFKNNPYPNNPHYPPSDARAQHFLEK